eukprot:scaffold23992_cov95-Isochrysis_galbana.AAC.1
MGRGFPRQKSGFLHPTRRPLAHTRRPPTARDGLAAAHGIPHLLAPEHRGRVLPGRVAGQLVHLAQVLAMVNRIGHQRLVALVLAVAQLVADRRVARVAEPPAKVLVVGVFGAGPPPRRVRDRHADHVLEALVVQRGQRARRPWAAQRHVQVVPASLGLELAARLDDLSAPDRRGPLEVALVVHLVERGACLLGGGHGSGNRRRAARPNQR